MNEKIKVAMFEKIEITLPVKEFYGKTVSGAILLIDRETGQIFEIEKGKPQPFYSLESMKRMEALEDLVKHPYLGGHEKEWDHIHKMDTTFQRRHLRLAMLWLRDSAPASRRMRAIRCIWHCFLVLISRL